MINNPNSCETLASFSESKKSEADIAKYFEIVRDTLLNERVDIPLSETVDHQMNDIDWKKVNSSDFVCKLLDYYKEEKEHNILHHIESPAIGWRMTGAYVSSKGKNILFELTTTLFPLKENKQGSISYNALAYYDRGSKCFKISLPD